MTLKKPIKIKLMPSLKEKKHYLVFKGEKRAAENALFEFLGVLGMAKANPQIIDIKGDKGIIMFNRDFTDEVRTALVFSGIHTIGISGTINKAKQKFFHKK
jgi:RNase P/RNase MRP subunit POP5